MAIEALGYWARYYEAHDDLREWYVPASNVLALVAELDPPRDAPVLELGCGSSVLGPRLATDLGFADVLCVDFEERVVERMRALHPPDAAPAVRFAVLDARDMQGVTDGSVGLVVAKGLIDTVTAKESEAESNAERIVGEIARVLRPGGRYIEISSFPPEARLMLAHPQLETTSRVLECTPYEFPDQDHVNAYILTRMNE